MKKKIVILLIIITLAGGLGFAAKHYLNREKKAELNSATVYAKLKDASDLTTQKYITKNVIQLKFGDIAFINQRKYLMVYSSKVYAGFDISKTRIYIKDKQVIVTIPHSKIQSINVVPEKYYSTNFSIKRSGIKDSKKAVKLAEKHALKEAKASDLLKNADRNSVLVVKHLLADMVNEKEVVVKFK